ncbi:hypothetical protein [Streptomyces sp. NPDC015125]|uniref:hypothetical protein n=1 Tax=Streptomyces sp. NPDC015125 TaxID=3364938 RepID=UPI0036F7E0E8
MSSPNGELRHVMPGSIFTPEVPLGPTRDALVTCHVSATGKGKGKGRLHGSPECRTLRSAASVDRIDIPLGEAVERFCANCRWPLPPGSPVLPLGAAVNEVESLTIWLDRDSKDEEDIEAERDAAIALATGEYPPHATISSDEEEEEGDEGGRDEERERYDRARNLRSGRRLQSRLTAVLDAERRAFAALAFVRSVRSS